MRSGGQDRTFWEDSQRAARGAAAGDRAAVGGALEDQAIGGDVGGPGTIGSRPEPGMRAHSAEPVIADVWELAARLGERMADRGLTVATAESCTGGLVAAAITDVPGSSGWFLGAVVAYANDVKTRLLEVTEADLAAEGAVSEAVALAMALGARRRLGTDLAVAITGIAGPGGATPDKPVGTVWIAVSGAGRSLARQHRFDGDRRAVRRAATAAALAMLLELLAGDPRPGTD